MKKLNVELNLNVETITDLDKIAGGKFAHSQRTGCDACPSNVNICDTQF